MVWREKLPVVTVDAIANEVEPLVQAFRSRCLDACKEMPDPVAFAKRRGLLALSATYASPVDFVHDAVVARTKESFEGKFGLLTQAIVHIVLAHNQRFEVISPGGRGVDLVVTDHVLDRSFRVFVKSGPDWGSADQWSMIAEHLKIESRATKTNYDVLPSYGIVFHSYGPGGVRNRKVVRKLAYVLEGQTAWYWASNNEDFYLDIQRLLNRGATEFMAARRDAAAIVAAQLCAKVEGVAWAELQERGSKNLNKVRKNPRQVAVLNELMPPARCGPPNQCRYHATGGRRPRCDDRVA